MKRKMLFLLLSIGLLILTVVLTSGCGMFGEKYKRVKDLEYTVLDSVEVPEEMLQQIELQKEKEFMLTYSDGEYLYIARGYGEQETCGYSIQVENLYLSEKVLYFEGKLVGPEKGEKVERKLSFPYIVVKTEYVEKPIVYE